MNVALALKNAAADPGVIALLIGLIGCALQLTLGARQRSISAGLVQSIEARAMTARCATR